MTFSGSRHRRLCIRCGTRFTWVVDFSHHLAACDKPFDIDLLLDELNVDIGKPDECWVMDDPRGTKYIPKFGVAPGVVWKAHVILATAMHGERPADLPVLCHWCDNRKCLNPNHLYWGTQQTNTVDAWRNGKRVMSDSQLMAMHEGRKRSEKYHQRMVEHNKQLGARQRGDNHWTRKSPEAMAAWTAAIRVGKEKAARAAEGGDAQ